MYKSQKDSESRCRAQLATRMYLTSQLRALLRERIDSVKVCAKIVLWNAILVWIAGHLPNHPLNIDAAPVAGTAMHHLKSTVGSFIEQQVQYQEFHTQGWGEN